MLRIIRASTTFFFCCAIVLTGSSAWADKPMDYERVLPFGGPFWDCTQFDGMDFWIWGRGRELDVGKIYFDKDGWWKQTVGKFFTDQGVLWVPADPGCNEPPFSGCNDPLTPMPGTRVHTLDDHKGTAEHRTVIYRDWIYLDEFGIWWPTWGQEMGLYFRMVIPGYGAIMNKAGLIKIQYNYANDNWDVLQVTPNRTIFDPDDVRAICSYMGNY